VSVQTTAQDPLTILLTGGLITTGLTLFVNWLIKRLQLWIYRENVVSELEGNCRWFAQLIMYELNHVYWIWYNEPPDLSKISPDLLNYLANKHPKYYHRIVKIEIGGYLK
jgi:hypothetical protein